MKNRFSGSLLHSQHASLSLHVGQPGFLQHMSGGACGRAALMSRPPKDIGGVIIARRLSRLQPLVLICIARLAFISAMH